MSNDNEFDFEEDLESLLGSEDVEGLSEEDFEGLLGAENVGGDLDGPFADPGLMENLFAEESPESIRIEDGFEQKSDGFNKFTGQPTFRTGLFGVPTSKKKH